MRGYRLVLLGKFGREVTLQAYFPHLELEHDGRFSARDHAIRDLRVFMKTGLPVRLYDPDGEVVTV